MGNSEEPIARLSSQHRAAIFELGFRGAGGEFDTHIMSELMTMGFVEVESRNRNVILTPEGRAVYQEILAKRSS